MPEALAEDKSKWVIYSAYFLPLPELLHSCYSYFWQSTRPHLQCLLLSPSGAAGTAVPPQHWRAAADWGPLLL